jgi:hypothetical protein
LTPNPRCPVMGGSSVMRLSPSPSPLGRDIRSGCCAQRRTT